MSDQLLYEVDGSVAVITLNRPEVRNAMSESLQRDLLDALDRVSAEADVRVVILTGAGPAFCSGGDVNEMQSRIADPQADRAVEGWLHQHHTLSLATRLHELDQLTIAAVNGPAVGFGFDLALACDFIVASPAAFFASIFVLRGLIPDGGSMYNLPRRIGLQKTKEIMLTGRRVEATEAHAIGLVDVLAPEGQLLQATTEYAQRFSGQPRASLMFIKSIVNQTFESTIRDIGGLGGEAQAICYTTRDHKESVERFLKQ